MKDLTEQDFLSGKVNLHIHTNYSDGKADFKKVLDNAKKNGYKLISITDHNTVEGHKHYQDEILVTGVEFDCWFGYVFIHLLAYNIDVNHPSLCPFLAKTKAETATVKAEKKETAAAKAIETKKDTTKKLETKAAVLVDTPEVQAEEVKETVKKAAKKVAAKADDTAEKAVKTVKKAAAKKTAAKTTKKAELKTEFFLQFSGKEYTEKEILKKVKDVWTKDLKNKVGDMKDVKIYLKPEESAAYYVVNGDTTGRVDL